MTKDIATLSMLICMWSIPTSESMLIGQATYMNPGRMKEVLEYRQVDLNGYVGPIALNRKGDLFRKVWVRRQENSQRGLVRTVTEGPFLSVDCAQQNHYLERERLQQRAEVDYPTAMRWGMIGVGPIPVELFFEDPGQWPEPK